MLLRSCFIAWTVLWGVTAAAVFVEKHEAASVLRRWRRANSGFLEEVKQGNLERECIEEICDYEEAREVFEDDDRTRRFWLTYEGRDPCEVNPCQNNGTCHKLGTAYECQCYEGFEGQYCQIEYEDSLKCLYLNGHCRHFCDSSGPRRRCFCADGYTLGEDGRDCVPNVKYPCGQVALPETGMNQSTQVYTRMVGSNQCPKGDCPWQVLVQFNGKSHCGGVLIHPEWVITAAHCIHGLNPQNLTVVAANRVPVETVLLLAEGCGEGGHAEGWGEHNLDVAEGTEQKIPVSLAIAHGSYVPATGDSDIALLQLNHSVTLNQHVIPICLPTRDFAERELLPLRYHIVSGWGKRTTGGNVEIPGSLPSAPVSPILRMMTVPILQNSLCSLRAKFNFTNNMLCAGYLEGRQQSCRGDDGSPLITLYGSTHFLTGVVGWGRGCSQPGYYGVYNNMANYVEWVEATMKNPPTAKTPELLEQKRHGERFHFFV